jgi:hypothetical protein
VTLESETTTLSLVGNQLLSNMASNPRGTHCENQRTHTSDCCHKLLQLTCTVHTPDFCEAQNFTRLDLCLKGEDKIKLVYKQNGSNGDFLFL